MYVLGVSSCSLLQVELPLGATEDRICGTIDIEKALQEGIKAYEPGLLVCLSPSSIHALTSQCHAPVMRLRNPFQNVSRATGPLQQGELW